MKTFLAYLVAALLVAWSGPALAQAPADAPLLAPDVPGTSIHLDATQAAPFSGRLISDAENERRAKKEANQAGTLADAKTNDVLLPRAAVAAVIGVAAAAVVTSVILGIAFAAKK